MKKSIDLNEALNSPIYRNELEEGISEASRHKDTAEAALNKLMRCYDQAQNAPERELASEMLSFLSAEMLHHAVDMPNNLSQNRLMFAGAILPDLTMYEVPVTLEKKHFNVVIGGMSYRFPYSDLTVIGEWLDNFQATNDAMDEARGRNEIEKLDLVSDYDRELTRLGFNRRPTACCN